VASRRRVIDLRDPRPLDAPPFVCPGCGAGLHWVRKVHLTSVRRPCRCRRGHVVHEVRCRACAEIVVLQDSSTGFVVVGRGPAVDKTLDRDDLARAIEQRLERNR
jgi:hypothetical protein